MSCDRSMGISTTFRIARAGMTVKIKKFRDKYRVSATPPDVIAKWRSETPLTAVELYNELMDRGANSVDTLEALFACDPDWERNSTGFHSRKSIVRPLPGTAHYERVIRAHLGRQMRRDAAQQRT